MNDGAHLYLALDNPNDTTMDSYDQMGVYFDDDPLPSGGQWTNTSCGHTDGEGNFWVWLNRVDYREWIAGPSACDVVSPAPGVSGSVGYDSGHTQTEIAIGLTSSALRATPGETINTYLWIYDAGTSTFDGRWPSTASFDDPSTYRRLTLAICSVPAVPNLSSPADGSSTFDTTPTFRWGSVSGATSYRIQVDDDPGFSSPVISQTTTITSYTPGTGLAVDTYYWRVRAINACGEGSWSSTWDLIRSTLSAPDLFSPTNGSTISDTTPIFSWSSVSGASSYHIQVDDDSGFSSLEIDETVSSTSHTPGSALPDGAITYWRVRASNPYGSGPWSAVWEFTISMPSPLEPRIYLPVVAKDYS